MTTLALIRHGHTPWNRAGRIQGRTDIALDPDAITELQGYKLPVEWQKADLVASPLLRAKETAKIIADCSPKIVSSLIEMDWGAWEGLRGVDLKADKSSGFRDIEDWGWDYCPPNGESPQDVWDRIKPWVMGLRKTTVAVCHIGIMRMILAKAHGWDFDGPAPFKIKRNRLYTIEIKDRLQIVDIEPIRLEAR
ncbi:histidine phosphatase family protein [Amylibacter sp. SFDW26]|uniref:histidine phosphatase family protein n=1 Tax=Amylibacter sp. SFDW26 TaxID=2652722 RepID=UPI00126187D0|nr:histidine phosphatase family protein [Amylibacter sp. SFDW26]KAB7616006.1 histidine phosphatase family protein [Amylibacter sp. SFDW26]